MSMTVAKHNPQTSGGFSLIPRNFDDAMKIAEMMHRSKSLPEHLRSPGDCLMVVEQAGRWEMSPFAVAQCTFSYKGKLGYEGKLIQAVLEGSPMARRIVASLMDYKYDGEGENRRITASALRVGETEPRSVTVTLQEARTSNEWWKRTPDQMLAYHAARVWARRWAPSILLGVYTIDEIYAPDPVEFDGNIIDGTAEPITREEINAKTASPTDPKPATDDAMTPREMADAMLTRITSADNEDKLHTLAGNPTFNRWRDMLKEHAADLDEEIAAALSAKFNGFALDGVPA